MSRTFKASAAQMTQNAKFSISVHSPLQFSVSSGTSSSTTSVNIANAIANSDMHKQLSSVFDQYRIDKVSLKFRLGGNTSNPISGVSSNITLFTCVDRTGFPAGITLAQLRTYQSYKESSFSTTGDANRTHYVALGQSGIISKATYYDTKGVAAFPQIYAGVDLGFNTSGTVNVGFLVEIDAQIRYRGVRLDTGAVRTSFN